MEAKDEKFPAQWALDLLEPLPKDYSLQLSDYFYGTLGAASSLVSCLYLNHYFRRPLLSRLHMTALYVVLGGLAGHGAFHVSRISRARQDEMMRDYIRQHPERFPEPENRKYADIFYSWTPIR